MLLLLFLAVFLFIPNNTSDYPNDRSIFASPLNIPLLLSSNFGELRLDHFHSGIDIKTQGVIGKEVLAASEGYIYRISVSPGGFGNALYIKHPSGYTTVYGHLNRFTGEIEDFLKVYQYEKKTFAVNMYPPKSKFPVRKGELIGYSGNSGSSGGPHLHYEIRHSDNEKPVNPLLFEFGTNDNITPVMEKLFIYPLSSGTSINGKNDIRKIDVAGGHGNYYIPADKQIIINGPAGFGIKAFDLLNDSYNKCAVYSIELVIDSMTVFKYMMDEFSFSESKFINSHIDYETYMRDKYYVQRTYLLPNDRLSVYSNIVNRGIFNFNEEKTYKASIIVTDVNNNESTLSFHIKTIAENKPLHEAKPDTNAILMPFNKQNRFISEDIRVNIPAGALYDNLIFTYSRQPGNESMLSDLHQVHNKFNPVHRTYTLSIKPKFIPAGKETKMLIIQLGENQKRIPLSSKWMEGYLVGEAGTFGNFYAGIDTIAPVIKANGLLSNSDLTEKTEIRIRITDDLSGIKSYEPEIDGNWALFEYDQKNDLLIYNIDGKRIKRNSEHVLKLKVTDNKDNTSYFDYSFTW